MNTTRIFIDYLGSFKSALREFQKEPSDWALVSPSGCRSQAIQLPSGFVCSTYRFGWIPQVLKVPKMPSDSSLAIFRKATFGPYLERLPWTTWPSKVPGHFSKEISLASKINLNSLRLSGDIQSPGMILSVMTLQTKTWLIKPHLETGANIKRTDSYWVYANTYIAMKIILTH